MTITVEVENAKIEKHVRERIAELFSDDARFRDGAARAYIRQCTDDAVRACGIPAMIAEMLPAISAKVMPACMEEALEKSMRAALREATKDGFDLRLLTDEQRAWYQEQAAKRARVAK
jgi:hypothetical protein